MRKLVGAGICISDAVTLATMDDSCSIGRLSYLLLYHCMHETAAFPLVLRSFVCFKQSFLFFFSYDLPCTDRGLAQGVEIEQDLLEISAHTTHKRRIVFFLIVFELNRKAVFLLDDKVKVIVGFVMVIKAYQSCTVFFALVDHLFDFVTYRVVLKDCNVVEQFSPYLRLALYGTEGCLVIVGRSKVFFACLEKELGKCSALIKLYTEGNCVYENTEYLLYSGDFCRATGYDFTKNYVIGIAVSAEQYPPAREYQLAECDLVFVGKGFYFIAVCLAEQHLLYIVTLSSLFGFGQGS